MLQIATNSSDAYYKSWQSLPILSKDQEFDLANKYIFEGCLESVKKLVYHNMRFVMHIVRQCCFIPSMKDDLVSCGTIGLMKAIKTFDPEQGVRLASFAVLHIKSEIQEYVLCNYSQLKIATTKDQRKLFFNLKRYLNVDKGLTQLDKQFISDELKVGMDDVEEMLIRMTSHPVYINHQDHYGEDGDDMEIVGGDCPSTVLEKMDNVKYWQKIHQIIDQLDPRSRDIIVSRWVNEEKTPLYELAEKYNISKERVRQIENDGIKKLHKLLT